MPSQPIGRLAPHLPDDAKRVIQRFEDAVALKADVENVDREVAENEYRLSKLDLMDLVALVFEP